jgi:septum formation protein
VTLVLASASPVRAELLRRAGVDVVVDPARIDEAAVKASLLAEGAPPRDVADKLAELKALRVGRRHSSALVLGVDQVLVHRGEILDKPGSRAEARRQLLRLRGDQHELLSAAVVVLQGASVWRHVGTARLTVRPFTDAFLEQYLDRMGDRVLETVGAYQLEDIGAQLFARVDGDYFTVLGLPLLEILGFLRARAVLTE